MYFKSGLRLADIFFVIINFYYIFLSEEAFKRKGEWQFLFDKKKQGISPAFLIFNLNVSSYTAHYRNEHLQTTILLFVCLLKLFRRLLYIDQ